ncbi:hypothetical protein MBBTH_21620 [Methanobrevibacter thaueri]|uniref:Uncharacterized protein n=1 Tax=Methanobrevibacter thaueri TaxID=190975 RepID=A0A315XJH1_9EURY|nr:hypothetical protein MBBTH_21620 [Methanobrevibacter thaueri]
MSSVLTNRQANNQYGHTIIDVNSVVVSANFNNHFTTGYISHSHSNGHILTNSNIHNRNNNTINHSIMFYNFKYCTVESCIIVISFNRSCNNSVITNNISIKGVVTVCIRSVDHTINSNNNRS